MYIVEPTARGHVKVTRTVTWRSLCLQSHGLGDRATPGVLAVSTRGRFWALRVLTEAWKPRVPVAPSLAPQAGGVVPQDGGQRSPAPGEVQHPSIHPAVR